MSAKYLTLVQAAELLATSPETVRYWIHVGKLAAYKPGRQVLVKESDLEELVEASAVSVQRATRAKVARAVRKGRAA